MTGSEKQFVVQEHRKENDVHWDFMLERGTTLLTYRLDTHPEKIQSEEVRATKIFDHPLKFLTYQGAVNNGRGEVHIVESGTYQQLKEEDSLLKFNLNGQFLRGKYLLRHINNDQWILTNERW